MGRTTKVRPQIKQVVIELTLQHPNFADLQIAQIILERFATPSACATINRLRHVAHFKFLPPKRSQKLSEIQRQQPYQFASDFINGKLPTEKLSFFDESRFCMTRMIGGCGEGEHEEGIFSETDKYPRISIHL
jgi:hypothetical protein